MKHILLFLSSLFMMLILLSCSPSNNIPMPVEEDVTFEEEEIKYEIEQVVFSKSFQSTDPNVEIISKKNKVKILASLGLAEYSDISINNVIKKGNVVNIHVSGIDGKNSSLAVPQVIMELNESKLKNIDNIKFNIVFDDYNPLKIKFGINDVINKIQSHFKISPNKLPTFNLIREDEHIVWDISYKGIFDKENPLVPLVNLSTLINANSGKMIESEKIIVSSTLDSGNILDYKPNNHILYKKCVIKDNETKKAIDQLWYLDTVNREKKILYSSDYKILSALFNFDKSYISLIETNEDNHSLYIISFEDKRAFKISFETDFNPKIMRWKDNSTLYLVGHREDASFVYSYNMENNETKLIKRVDMDINNLAIRDDMFIITEKIDNEINRNIYATTNWSSFQPIDYGFNVKFLSDNLIAYLKKNEKNDSNSLYIYDISDEKIVNVIEGNISNYDSPVDEKLIYVNKNTNNNDYTIVKYSIDYKTTEDITTIIGDKVYFDEGNGKIYLNVLLPFEDNKTEMIYSIDLDKLNQ